ncbi:MAG: GNAT family N-acetyltransferase [Lewinellaceae bacterium]|nr:GNAT family N-acetyltransferase [Lewinellaceae bacterium]
MKVYPTLETERLVLRAPAVRDIPEIVRYAGNPEIAKTTLNIPNPYREMDAVFWINMAMQGFETRSKYIFALELKSTGKFIGGMGLHVDNQFNRAEAGYWIAVPYWKQGLASEGLATVLRFGFEELELNKIYATHLLENPASGRVMQKNGMIKEGELVDHFRKDNAYRTVAQYRLTRAEYEKITAS